jgi:hypothetical protein
MFMKIILQGLEGSVGSIKYSKIATALQQSDANTD